MYSLGPWTAGRAIPEDGAVSRIVRAGDDHIAVVMSLEDAAQEAADNARLIAAAPELLAALQWALSQIEDSLDPDHQAALKSARAVVARATGGA